MVYQQFYTIFRPFLQGNILVIVIAIFKAILKAHAL